MRRNARLAIQTVMLAGALAGCAYTARKVENGIQGLRSLDLAKRVASRESLIRIGRPSVEPLIRILCDGDEFVPLSAALALRSIGSPAVDPLIAALKDPDTQIRGWSAWILGEIKEPRAALPLTDLLKDPHSRVRRITAGALLKITGQPFGEDEEKWRQWLEENP